MTKTPEKIVLDFNGTDPQARARSTGPRTTARGDFAQEMARADPAQPRRHAGARRRDRHQRGRLRRHRGRVPAAGHADQPKFRRRRACASSPSCASLGVFAGCLAKATGGRMPADQETIRIWGMHGGTTSDALLPLPRGARRRVGRPLVRRRLRRHPHRAELAEPAGRVLRDALPDHGRAARRSSRTRAAPGSRRGGLGYDKKIRALQDVELLSNADRSMLALLRRQRRHGRAGPTRSRSIRDGREPRAVPGLSRRRRGQGRRRWCGSSPPAAAAGATRSSARSSSSRWDVIRGVVSRTSAERDYGVVLLGDGEELAVDEEATAARRARHPHDTGAARDVRPRRWLSHAWWADREAAPVRVSRAGHARRGSAPAHRPGPRLRVPRRRAEPGADAEHAPRPPERPHRPERRRRALGHSPGGRRDRRRRDDTAAPSSSSPTRPTRHARSCARRSSTSRTRSSATAALSAAQSRTPIRPPSCLPSSWPSAGSVKAAGPRGVRRDLGGRALRVSLHDDARSGRGPDRGVVPGARPPATGYAFMEVSRRHGDYALAGVACVLSGDGAAPGVHRRRTSARARRERRSGGGRRSGRARRRHPRDRRLPARARAGPARRRCALARERAATRRPVRTVRVRVNDRDYERSVEPRLLLSDFLRHELEPKGHARRLRARRLRLLHRAPGRRCRALVPALRGPGGRRRDHDGRGPRPGRRDCTRSRPRSASATPCNAGSARRAS